MRDTNRRHVRSGNTGCTAVPEGNLTVVNGGALPWVFSLSAEGKELEPVHLPRVAVRLPRLSFAYGVAAVLLGAVSAFAAAWVRLGFRGLQWLLTQSGGAAPMAANHLGAWRRVLTPMVGALLASLVLFLRRRRAHRLGREPRPYVEYVEAVRHGHGTIPLLPNCWRTLSAAFSVASGAAVGREGSMIQFAAAIASAAGKWLSERWGSRLEKRWGSPRSSRRAADAPLDLSLLVAFGIAGGVVTAYNAPVAAVFFAAEIVLGGLDWRELPLLALAAGSGWLVSGSMLGWKRLYPTPVSMPAGWWWAVWLPLMALLFGVLGPGYQKLIRGLQAGRKLPLALLWGGLLVGLLSVWDPRVWGNGDFGLSAALGRAELPGFAIAAPALGLLLGLRLLATTACVSTGTVGGAFTPTLFAGGAVGALLGHLLVHVGQGSSSTLWAIAGMSCLMAAVTHAPLMAACMAVELTGNWRLLPGLIVLNGISWQVARSLSGAALYAIASEAPGRHVLTQAPEPAAVRTRTGYNGPGNA
ncbi:MAG: chloride channel protein [Janthinobacterium lividum]